MKKIWKIFRRKFARALLKNPFDLAHYFCQGKGLEIGAMTSPYAFGNNCTVEYADILDINELKNIAAKIPIPNLYAGKFVPVSYHLKGPRYGLEMIDTDFFDFVYSSNSLEHTPNPIWALIEQLRVTKINGIVYAAIPNKNYTYDVNRLSTPVEKLISRYINLDFKHTLEDAMDIILNTQDHPLYNKGKTEPFAYAQEILDGKEGIHHFFVFDEVNTLKMLLYVSAATGATIEYFSATNNRDIQFVLRKKKELPPEAHSMLKIPKLSGDLS